MTSVAAELTDDDILSKVVQSTAKGQNVAYTGVREYRVRNYRFHKEAVALVQVTYRPDSGKDFTILQQSGSPKLIEILEKVFASEAEVSSPARLADLEISPANYKVRLRGTDATGGRACYVVELIPRRKSKYLIKGTAWIDRASYGIVRVEGITSASVSMWVGTPHITEDFSQVSGLWLPAHTASVSSGLLFGASELEVQYMDYVVADADHLIPSRTADVSSSPRQ